MKIKKLLYFLLLVTTPGSALAQTGNWNSFGGVVNIFLDLGKKLIPLMGVLALLAFVIGVGRFIRSSGSDTEMTKTKNILTWGVVGLFVLFSIWGIVAFLRSEFGFGGGKPVIPLIQIK